MTRYLKVLTRLVLDNAGLKLSSLILALLLWIALNGEPHSESEVSFEIHPQYLMPPHLELVDNPTESVYVRLRSTSNLVNKLDPSNISVSINLASAEPGERVYSITPSDIARPPGVRVTHITPSAVRLNLQPTMSKKVEIDPRIVGQVDDGYQLQSVTSRPDRAVVEGTKERVAAMTRVTTDSIDVTGRSTSFVARVYLDAEDGAVRFPEGRSIEVEIAVVPLERP